MKPHGKPYSRFPAVALLVLGVALVVGASPALAQRTRDANLRTNPKIMAAFRDTVAKPSQSVVRVQCDDKDAALGTVVAPDGWIVTKASLLKGDKVVCRLKDGKALPAKVVGVHDAHDLAMLKVDAKGLMPIEWKASKEAVPGNWVATAGPSLDPLAIGVVSVASRDVPVRSYPRSFNPNGGFLGVTMDPDTHPVKVVGVADGSAAAKAGIKVGDLILEVDKKPIVDQDELRATLQKHKPNDVVTLRIKRDKEEMEMKATLGGPPKDLSRGDVQNSMGSALSERRTGFPQILQHDTVVEPKDCGGPLVDLDGKAVGINIARAGRTESYAVPSDTVQTLLADLKSGKLAPVAATSVPKPGDVASLQAEVKQQEELAKTSEALRDGLKKLLAQADELRNKYGKDNEDLLDVHNRTLEKVKSAEATLAKVKAELEKAKADLKKAQEKAVAPKSEK